MIYTPSFALAVEDEDDLVAFIRHSQRDDIAYKVTLSKGGSSNVHSIYSIVEGYARPAWYPAFTPDSMSGGLTFTQSALFNQQYWRFNDGTDTADWTVPSSGDGSDTIIITYVQVSGGGVCEVVKNPGASEVVLGTVDTNGASTVWRATKTLTVAPISAGDTIRLRWSSGDARICGFLTYDSDGSPASGDVSLAVTSASNVHYPGSSVEFAYAIAAAGATPKFVGGYAHQGGSYSIEVSPVQTWLKDGAPWSPTVGAVLGTVRLSRTTTVYYDAVDTDIAALSYFYEFAFDGLRVSNDLTATVEIDATALYCAMVAPLAAITSYVEVLPKRDLIDVTVDDGSEEDVSAGSLQVSKRLRAMWTPLSQAIVFDLERLTNELSRMWVWKVSAQYDKFYAQISGGSSLPAGTTFGAAWRWSAESGYGGERRREMR